MRALVVRDLGLFRAACALLVRLAATVASPDARQAGASEGAVDVAECAAATLDAWLTHAHESAAVMVEPLEQCAAGRAMRKLDGTWHQSHHRHGRQH